MSLTLNDTGTLDLFGGTVTVGALGGNAGLITNSSATPALLNTTVAGTFFSKLSAVAIVARLTMPTSSSTSTQRMPMRPSTIAVITAAIVPPQ